MIKQQECPACGSVILQPALSRRSLEADTRLRDAFVTSRLGHAPDFAESMDLTRFLHGGPARLLACRNCGLILRDEADPGRYEDEIYDSALMQELYPRYLHAFERRKPHYEPLLRSHAEVIEVGSHLGAFLQTAEQWDWRPTGLDIGKSTSAFARRRGLSVKRIALEDYSPKLGRPDAIFIWNCFEQLEDPSSILRRSHELLERHGVLVVRVPNADFYRKQRRQIQDTHSARALNALGYNNLLGFPYLHGFTPAALDCLLRAHRFAPVAAHNSSLLTPPYPQMSPQMREQWREVRGEGESSPRDDGPWIEVASRRLDEMTQ